MSVLSFSHTDSASLARSPAHFDSLLSIEGVVRIRSLGALSVVEVSLLDLMLSARGLVWLGSALLAFQHSHTGPPFLLRQYARVGFGVSTFGKTCISGSTSVIDFGIPGLALSLRSFAQAGTVSSAFSLTRASSPLPSQQFGHLGSAVPAPGAACLGALIAVADAAHADLLLPLRSYLQLGFAVLQFSAANLALSPLMKGFGRLGSSVLVLGLSCAGPVSLLSVTDLTSFDLSVLVRSMAQPGLTMPAPHHVHADLPASFHSFLQVGSIMFSVGMSCSDVPFLATDSAHTGLLSSFRSLAKTGLAILVLDDVSSGSTALPRSLSQANSPLLAFGFARIGLSLASRQSARAGLAVFALGCTRPGFGLIVVDSVSLASSSSIRSNARPGLLISAFRATRLAFLLFLRNLARCGSSLLVMGLAWIDFTLPLVSEVYAGAPLPARSFCHAELPLSAVDFAHLDLTPSLHSSARPGPVVLTLKAAHLASSAPARSFSCAGSMSPASCFARLGALPSLQQLARSDATLLAAGLGWAETPTLVVDSAHMGSLVFPRSLAHLGPAAPMLAAAGFGFSMSLRSSSWPGPSLFATGACCSGSVFSLPVVEMTSLESPALLRSFACVDLSASVFMFVRPGSLLSTQSPVCAALAASVVGVACMEAVAPAADVNSTGSTLFLQTFSHPEPAVLILRYLHSGPSLLVHSFLRLDSPVLALDPSRLDSLLLLRSLGHLGLAVSAAGVSRPGFSSLIVDVGHLGLPVLLHSPT